MILPVTLTLGSVGVLVFGGIYAATFLKGSDNVLRYSIDTSALQLLYLPVPASVKMQVKSFIDTVIWRLGDGLAGLTLLVFATYLNFRPNQISWVNLIFLGLWFVVANTARRQYVAILGERIQQHRIDAESTTAPVLDRSTTSIMASRLDSTDTEEILYGLSLFEVGYHQTSHPSMRGLIRHPSPEVRAKALAILNAGGDKSVVDDVEELLRDDDPQVRTEALLYLAHHSHIDPVARLQEITDFPDFTIRSSIAAFLARPGKAHNLEASRMMLDMMIDEAGPDGRQVRLEAARLIGTMPEDFEEQLARSLRDNDPEIAREAIQAAGRLGKRRFVPDLLEHLSVADCRESATESLAGFGNRILGTLRDYMADEEIPIEIRRQIPTVMVALGTEEAQALLVENLFQGDSALRFRIISALNKSRRSHPEIRLDTQMVETVLAAEILGHYRSYQALGALVGKLEREDPSMKALEESIDQEVERIFRLLGILFPKHDLHAAHIGLRASDSAVHDNVLEFLDITLRPELRELLVPLIDSGVRLEERVRRADALLGTRVETSEEAVSMLIHSGDPWLRSCAAYAIGTLGLRSMEAELEAWGNDPDPLLVETVKQAREKLATGHSGD